MNARLMAIVMLFLFAMPQSKAFIYMATVLRKWDDCAQRYQTVIGLGDFHAKGHAATHQHRKQIEQLLAQVSATRVKLLVEDLSSCPPGSKVACAQFVVNSRGGLLGGLTEIGQAFGLKVENLEYRYARVCALAPVLNDPFADPVLFPSVKTLTLGHMFTEIANELDVIGRYDDGSWLNSWYAERTGLIKQRLDRLKWQKMTELSVATMLRSISYNKRRERVAELLTFDSALFDIKLVHAITTNIDTPCVCAIAGGSHIKRVAKVLRNIGYEEVTFDMPATMLEPSIADAIEVIDTHTDIPQPISLQWLAGYF